MEKIKNFGRKLNDNKGLILTAVVASVAINTLQDKLSKSDEPTVVEDA